MAEGNCTVVREVLLDQHMAVEASHFRNCEYADGTKGMGCNRQNLALCDVSPQLVVCGGLQAVEGDITGDNISLQSAVVSLQPEGISP